MRRPPGKTRNTAQSHCKSVRELELNVKDTSQQPNPFNHDPATGPFNNDVLTLPITVAALLQHVVQPLTTERELCLCCAGWCIGTRDWRGSIRG